MCFRKRARRLCTKFGLRPKLNQKPGSHLEWSHPSLEHLRSYIRNEAQCRNVHPRLIINFDQVWTTRYRPAKTSLQKTSAAGSQLDGAALDSRLKRLRHQVERVLDLEFSDEYPCSKSSTMPLPEVQGGPAAVAMIDDWRSPRTLTTCSFIDGHIARGYVTCRKGSISNNVREWANSHLKRWLYVAEPQQQSHIWNESSLIQYLQFLAGEIRTRRAQLGLTASDKALVLMDQAGAHMSRTFKQIQQKWSQEHNVVPWQHLLGKSTLRTKGLFIDI